MELRSEVIGSNTWVVKSASTDAEARRLRHEAAQLRRAAHPGVIELGRFRDDDLVELWTRDAGRSLADYGPLAIAEIGGLGAAVATLLADLHDLGVVHGSVHADHILVGFDGRPVLCGFGASGSVDDLDTDADVRDLVTTLAERLPPDAPRRMQRLLQVSSRARPVAARSLASALARAVPDRRLPPPGTRNSPDIKNGPAERGAPRWERRVADPEDAPDPDASAGPERVGAALAGDVGRPRPERPVDHERHRPTTLPLRPSRRRRAAAVAIGAAVFAAVGLHLIGALRPGRVSATTCPAQDQGCRPVAVHDGQFTTVDGRFAVAIADPVVVVGRWNCGTAGLPAALDPRSGRVWTWRSWAGTVGTVAATAVATRPGARSLRVVPVTGACDRLEVIGPGHSSAVLSPGGGRRA